MNLKFDPIVFIPNVASNVMHVGAVVPVPPPTIFPTANFCVGFVVPIPIFPPRSTIKCVDVDEPMTNAFSPAVELIESRANGEVDEMPIFPVKLFVLENVLKSERRVEDALEPPVERHVPLIAKHPFVILNPTFEVEVA